MNETRNKKEKGPEHFITITSFTDTHLRAFVPLSSQLSPRIEYVSFIRSFIHSFIPRRLCQCHLTPTPLSAPLGALNGSWRRCGTLCCFQEALLNAVCPVALSLFFPILSLPSHPSIEMYCIFCSHHKVQHYVWSFCNKKIPEVKMLHHRKVPQPPEYTTFKLWSGDISAVCKQIGEDIISSACTAIFLHPEVQCGFFHLCVGVRVKWIAAIHPASFCSFKVNASFFPPGWRREGLILSPSLSPACSLSFFSVHLRKLCVGATVAWMDSTPITAGM